MVADGDTKKAFVSGKITLEQFLGEEKTNYLLNDLKERALNDIRKSNDYRTLKDLILLTEQTNSRLERIENKLTDLEVDR